jgi:S-adenosylmethionine hydrolase
MCPQVRIVDISHDTSHLENVAWGAYKLRNAYPFFPEGSVHVVGVDSEAFPDEPFIVAESKGQLFICRNNGFLSLALDDFGSATAIASPDGGDAAGFSILHAAPPIIQKLLQGEPAGSLGEAIAPKVYTQQQPVVRISRLPAAGRQDEKLRVDAIVGHILYVDGQGNAITNITRKLFYDSAKGRTYNIFINSDRYCISQVSSAYADVQSGMPVAFFNSQELLEIAVSYGNASHLYRLDGAGRITVEFKE